jgi:hypothetical protein
MKNVDEDETKLSPFACAEDGCAGENGADYNAAGVGKLSPAGGVAAGQTNVDLIGSMRHRIKICGDIFNTGMKWDSEG